MYSSLSRNKSMISARQHPPVILLLGERSTTSDSIDQWLAESRYCALEAADAYQAFEHLSDFTQAERPDVVFLHVDSKADDLRVIQALVTTSADEPDVPIIDFAQHSSSECAEEFQEAMAGLVCRLDEFIPPHNTMTA